MRFSVITCTWNSEPFIAQSIDSVLAQDYPNIEYIFVDGSSTDGSLQRIQSIPRETKVLHDIRGGISHAMNAGLDVATGDVIVHLHADDYFLHPRVLTEVAEAFQRSGAKWLFGRAMSDMNDGRLIPEDWVVPRYSYPRLIKGNFIPHQATFIRKDLFDLVGRFDEKYKYAMDYDLWLRLGRLAEPLQLDTHLVAFRRHQGSLSTANQLAGFKEDFGIRMRYVGNSPIETAMHYARYFVRLARIKRSLRACGGAQRERGASA